MTPTSGTHTSPISTERLTLTAAPAEPLRPHANVYVVVPVVILVVVDEVVVLDELVEFVELEVLEVGVMEMVAKHSVTLGQPERGIEPQL